jgi:hypothetical protein
MSVSTPTGGSVAEIKRPVNTLLDIFFGQLLDIFGQLAGLAGLAGHYAP